MRYRNENISMGTLKDNEYTRFIVLRRESLRNWYKQPHAEKSRITDCGISSVRRR